MRGPKTVTTGNHLKLNHRYAQDADTVLSKGAHLQASETLSSATAEIARASALHQSFRPDLLPPETVQNHAEALMQSVGRFNREKQQT